LISGKGAKQIDNMENSLALADLSQLLQSLQVQNDSIKQAIEVNKASKP
jgi:hypothetical protein